MAAGCRTVTVEGIVQTPEEKPVARAVVSLLPVVNSHRPLIRHSEASGCFDLYEIVGRHQSGYTFSIESAGFKPLSIAVTPSSINLLLVTLQPLSTSKPSEARPISRSERHDVYEERCEPEVMMANSSLTLH